MQQRLLRVLIALDIFVFALVTFGGAKRNETISAAAWVLEQDGRWQGKLARPVIDWIMTWVEREHCRVSWIVEKDKY